MLRGNGGMDIFRGEADALAFQKLMLDGLERFGHRVHAWCFMVNHVHLLIEVGDQPLSKIMQNLSFRYTRHFNTSAKRIGHVFQGRYKALLVEDDSYLITLLRYMHQNPVAAGLCRQAADWRWSSDKAYRTGTRDGITFLDHLQGMLGQTPTSAINGYAKLMKGDANVDWPPKDMQSGDVVSDAIVGSEPFVKKMRAKRKPAKARAAIATPEALIKACADVSGVSLEQMQGASRERWIARARYMTAIVLRDKAGLTMTNIAGRFGRDLSTLSRGVNAMETAALGDEKLGKTIAKFQRAVIKQSK